jgi:NHS family xanthosine MFS transporter
MAFDFFNISGSLYVETQSDPGMRASAQGLFMMMSNGLGAFLGTRISGIIIDNYFTITPGRFNWQGIWLTFAAYALIVAILFAIFFRYKHNLKKLK